MSDRLVTFLSLDAAQAQAADVIDEQVDWLLDREIIAPAAVPDRFYGAFREGRRFADAFDPDSVPAGAVAGGDSWLFGVRVEKGWQMATSMDGFAPPPCPRCGTEQPIENGGRFMLDWLETRTEPTAVCAHCGHTDLVGNWPDVHFGYGTYASLSFVNSYPVAAAFERDLLARIGRRPRVVYVRI